MMADNPFLPGGDISKDAEEIVNAFKAGKLSCLSDNGKNVQETDSEDDEKMESIVQPLERKVGVIGVKTDVYPSKTEPQESVVVLNRRNVYCCALS